MNRVPTQTIKLSQLVEYFIPLWRGVSSYARRGVELTLIGVSLTGCAATPENNDAWLMPTTGQYQAQDTDTEQNGEQSFDGQLNYMQEQKQDQQQQQQQSNQIQDQMSQEYQQQIQQQKNAQ